MRTTPSTANAGNAAIRKALHLGRDFHYTDKGRSAEEGTTLTCSNCGTINEGGRKFCMECGHPLAAARANCGATNPPEAKFCGECGNALARVPGGQSPGAAIRVLPGHSRDDSLPVAERRLVSVLFADLVGFTTLSESRDAEDVRELLGRYFDKARHLVALYGGAVEKFIGDAVMAVWGTPTTQEDDAERSVRAALELVEAVNELGKEVRLPYLRARAGVLTGEAAVTIGAEGQGMVAGDLVNTASRLQSLADPGTVLVGDSTRRVTDAAVAYEDAGVHELKGKSEPVRLWRAERIIAGIGGAIKSSSYEGQFVGRQRELRLLKELFHASAESHKAQLASVIGIAGIGKSRLTWEFFKYIDGLAQDIWWHRGRCLSYGEGVTYWALAEMARMRARITEGEEASAARAKLGAVVDEFVKDPEERRWIEPRLAHLLGLEERTGGKREDLFAAWRLFFERIARRDPVVMVFDDIQWADASLLDFIEYLLEWSKDLPIFVVTLGRPEVLEQRPTWGVGKRTTALFLEPLSADAMRELVENLVPGLPPRLGEEIVDRAEGVPLYAVETVRMLIDRELVFKRDNVFTARADITTLEIPQTLHALIAARLDGLPASERHLLQDASVFGKTFTKAAITSLSEFHQQQEQQVQALLTSLVRKEFLSLQADPRSPDRGQYGFLQDLVKRVAYQTLSKRDRKVRHLTAARYLETTWGGDADEIVEVVGSHYLQAFGLCPEDDDAPILRRRARELLAQAGERAGSLAANEEAESYFCQAADLTDDPVERAMLLDRAGAMAGAGARTHQAIAHLEEARDLLENEGESHRAARVSARLGERMWDVGRIDDAVEMMDRSFAVLSDDIPDEDIASLAAQLGRLLLFAGRPEPAAGRINMALEAAESLGLPEVLSEALNTQAVLRLFQGRKGEAVALLRYALEIALEDDLPSSALRAYFNLAAIEINYDRYENSRGYVEDGLLLARRLGHRQWEWNLLSQDVYPLFALGKWDAAVANVDEIPPESFSLARSVSATLIGVLPLIHAHRGELEEASKHLDAFAEAETSADVQERVAFSLGKAAILRSRGRSAEALKTVQVAVNDAHDKLDVASEFFREAAVEAIESAFLENDESAVREVLAIIDETPPGGLPQSLWAHSLRAKARLAIRSGDSTDAESMLRRSVHVFRELSVTFWMAVTLLELAEWLYEQGREKDAAPMADEAQEVFAALRAYPWLQRVSRLPIGSNLTA
jgi:class 3 adenylate cyclase/tetratricopeptide (TPR) repeat protein